MAESEATQKAIEAGHEERDLSPKSIVVFALSLAGTIALVIWVCYALFTHFSTVQMKTQTPASPLVIPPKQVPGPQLVVRSGEEYQRLLAAEEALLKSYGWVDRDKGLVHIPIERAIDILAQKGLPARAQSGSEGKSAKASP